VHLCPALAFSRDVQVAAELDTIEERWWHRPDVNDAETMRLSVHERKAEAQQRVSAFTRWVCSRPEKRFVVFGHGKWISMLTKRDKILANCEICEHRI
jgi:Histidine phosphatase superfamily (branch 1)